MKQRLLIGFLISVFILAVALFYKSYAFLFFVRDGQVIRLVLKENFFSPARKEILVEVARTSETTTQGLSGRSTMQSVTGQSVDGLLFVFQRKGILRFWMKEMLFDIDICWLDSTTFLSCQRSASKPVKSDQELIIYSPKVPANVALETKPGFLSDNELQLKLFFQW